MFPMRCAEVSLETHLRPSKRGRAHAKWEQTVPWHKCPSRLGWDDPIGMVYSPYICHKKVTKCRKFVEYMDSMGEVSYISE